MNTKAKATLTNGEKVSGWLTTEHAASSYGQPVFVDDNKQAYNWIDIKDIDTATDMRSRGGQATSETKTSANRAKSNLPPKEGKKPRGRPKAQPTPGAADGGDSPAKSADTGE